MKGLNRIYCEMKNRKRDFLWHMLLAYLIDGNFKKQRKTEGQGPNKLDINKGRKWIMLEMKSKKSKNPCYRVKKSKYE